ncbi:MAG: tryptophan synthase subunit alpha [Pseudomonadota bacterium]
MNSGANRIDQRFEALRSAGKKGLIPYITAGHPSPAASVALMHECVAAGADLLELGVPFSDVMADGPVIQRACQTALEAGTDIDAVLSMVAEFRRDDPHTPVILMGYMNPLERRGAEVFSHECAAAGVDGVLIVDCPFDEAQQTQATFAQSGLHQIFLVAPTSTAARIERMVPMAGGFIYYVSLKGVTGAATLDAQTLQPAIRPIRHVSDLPIAVGFGISTPEQAAAAAAAADAVVIGSALVQRLDAAQSVDEARVIARDYLAPVRAAMDTAGSTDSALAEANVQQVGA